LAEEEIRIVLDGLRGESSIAELCRREGIAEGLYYSWSKEFLEAGKRRLAGDTAQAATSSEVTELRRQCRLSLIKIPSAYRKKTETAEKPMSRVGSDSGSLGAPAQCFGRPPTPSPRSGQGYYHQEAA
jgi:transposase